MDNAEILKLRKSVRSYDSRSIPEEMRRKLNSVVTFINTHEAGLNFQICYDDPAPFYGAMRSYGMFHGVRNYLAVVVDPTFPNAYERAGYFAEQFVIECVKLGLGTCFVKATFSAAHVGARMEVYEKMPFVVTFGFPDDKGKTFVAKLTETFAHRNKMSLRDFFAGSDEEYRRAEKLFPRELPKALEAVACAPSAYNKRPARIALEDKDDAPRLAVTVLDPERDAVELGIARFNVDFMCELAND